MKIEDLYLTTRSECVLKAAGITTVEQLIKCSEIDLLKLTNFGKKSLTEIKDVLAQRNLRLDTKVVTTIHFVTEFVTNFLTDARIIYSDEFITIKNSEVSYMLPRKSIRYIIESKA